MELDLTQQFLTENDCYQAGRTIVPKGIMVHSTGVAQPDPEVFIRRWNKPGVEKCVHAFVARTEPFRHCPGSSGAGMRVQAPPAGARTTLIFLLSAVSLPDTPTVAARWWGMM